jgi:hypothetical protein
MKYLREYEEEEIKSLMGDLESIGHKNLMGWVVMKHYSPTSYSHPKNPAGVEKYLINFYVVGAHSFEEAIKIFHKNAFPDTKYKFFDTLDIDNEKDFLGIWVTEYSNHKRNWKKLLDADMVSGLKGKGGKPFFAKLDSENPFAIVSFLNEKFTNAEEAFTKKFRYGPGFTMEYKEF